LCKVADFLLPEADVIAVRYFTSRVKRRIEDDNPDAGLRQQVFLRALETFPKLTIHYGHFQRNKVRRRLVDDPSRTVRVVDYKEKGSDVNLAAYLVYDALNGACELAGVMSGDSDLVEPVKLAESVLEHGVVILHPNVGQPSRALAQVARDARRISDRLLRSCHLPVELSDAVGVITKPPIW
jgi:hypothetical protein